MDRLLKINGKSYKAAEFDINFMCDMEDKGIQIEDLEKKMFSMIRAYVALCMGTDVARAGKEISEHIKNGGTIEDISETMSQMMEESDFFRSTQTKSDQASQKRTSKKRTEEEEVEKTI